jgi:predicted nucleic acid-binding protein
MSGRAFFDTNVLVYAIGQDDVRTPIAESLLAQGGVLSVQVLNELASVARRKLGMSWEEVKEALAALRSLCEPPIPITVETHDKALSIATRHRLHLCDAVIVAAAIEAECETLYSEDFQSGQVVERRLTIRNPFRT